MPQCFHSDPQYILHLIGCLRSVFLQNQGSLDCTSQCCQSSLHLWTAISKFELIYCVYFTHFACLCRWLYRNISTSKVWLVSPAICTDLLQSDGMVPMPDDLCYEAVTVCWQSTLSVLSAWVKKKVRTTYDPRVMLPLKSTHPFLSLQLRSQPEVQHLEPSQSDSKEPHSLHTTVYSERKGMYASGCQDLMEELKSCWLQA